MAQFIFEPTEKMILAFERDLRDIDGATHFIQYKFVQFHRFHRIYKQKW